MKMIILALLLTSCLSNPSEKIKQHLQNNKSFDYRLWTIRDLVINNQKDLSPSCKEYKFTYTLFLEEECHPKKIIDNSVFNYFADDNEYYKWNRCWSKKIINEKVTSFNKKLKLKKNTKICSRKKHTLFGGPCIEWRNVDDNYIAVESKKYKKNLNSKIRKDFLRKGNIIQIEDDLRICD